MSDRFRFLDMPFSGVPKGDPCHFRFEVTGEGGKQFVRDFLIKAANGCPEDDAKKLGRGFQKLLKNLDWGDDPQAAFSRDVIGVLLLMVDIISRESRMGSRIVVAIRGLDGVVVTFFNVSGPHDCERLMKVLKEASKELSLRK